MKQSVMCRRQSLVSAHFPCNSMEQCPAQLPGIEEAAKISAGRSRSSSSLDVHQSRRTRRKGEEAFRGDLTKSVAWL